MRKDGLLAIQSVLNNLNKPEIIIVNNKSMMSRLIL